jgi:hypothetical protein
MADLPDDHEFVETTAVRPTLPEPQFLKLSEAVRRVAASCGVSESNARERLDRAFHDGELVPVSTDGKSPDTWESAEIDWDTSTISCPSPLGDGSHTRAVLTNMRVSRSHLDEWMAPARSKSMKREATARLVRRAIVVCVGCSDNTLPLAGGSSPIGRPPICRGSAARIAEVLG